MLLSVLPGTPINSARATLTARRSAALTGGALASGFLFALMSSTSVTAACSPSNPTGDSVVTCSGTDGVGFTVSGSDSGKKTITVLTGAKVTGDIQLGQGNDWIENQGTLEGALNLGSAQMNAIDRVVNGSTAAIGLTDGSGIAITGGGGRQELHNLGIVTGGVSLGSDDDQIINEGRITGAIDLGSASTSEAGDYLNSSLGTIGSDGSAASGGYTSTLNTAVIIGGSGTQRVLLGEDTYGNVSLGADADQVVLVADGRIEGNVDLGGGDDSFQVQSDDASVTGTVEGGDGYDALVFAGGAQSGSGTVQGSINDTLTNLTLSSMEAIKVDGAGTWQVTSNLVTGLDTLIEDGTLEVLANVTLDGNNLVIGEEGELAGDGTASFIANAPDQAVNEGLISITQLNGDAGDTVFSNLGTIAVNSTVDLGAGADTVIETGNILGTLSLGAGDDTHVQISSPAFTGVFSGGAGVDTLQLNTTDGGEINGANFTDFEEVQQVTGSWTLSGTQNYATSISIAGGTLTTGQEAHLTLAPGANITADINGTGTGSQTLLLNGTTYTGTANLGDGDDQFILVDSSTITGTLDGGAGTGDSMDLRGTGTLSSPVINVETASVNGDWTIAAGNSYTFVDGFTVQTGSLTNNGDLVGPVVANAGTTLAGTGGIDGDLTISGSYTGALTLSPNSATANTLTLTDTGVMAAGSTLDLGAGSDSFVRLGTLDGTVLFGDGADTYSYYSSDPAMTATGIIDGGTDSSSDTLQLLGNRDGTAYTGAEILIDPAQFTNWNGLDIDGGDWAIGGDVTFVDGVTIDGGELDVDGILRGPGPLTPATIAVGPTGTLGGTGTIVGNVVSDGTISPAGVGPIGTLTIEGNLTLNPDSNLIIDASASPLAADLLVVSGNAQLGGTLTVEPLDELPQGLVIDFLEIGGTSTGTFDTLQSSNPGLSFTVDMDDPNNPQIIVGTEFGVAATEQNINNTGAYLNDTDVSTALNNDTDGDKLQTELLAVAGTDAEKYILAQMSPDLYDQNTAALFERNRHFQAGMMEHLARCDVQRRFVEEFVESCNSRRRQSASKANVWTSVGGFSIDEEGDNKFLDYRLAGGAAQFGIDGQLFPGVVVGGSFSAGRSTFDNDIRGGGTTTDYDVGIYSQVNLVQERSVTVDLGVAASLGFGQNKADRQLDILNQTYSAEFNTTRQSFGAVLGIGSEHKALFFGGKLSSNLSMVQREQFEETGNGSLTFIVDEGNYSQVDLGLEGDVGYRVRMSDDFYFIPKLSAGVTQLVSGDRREMDTKLTIAKNLDPVLTVENFDPGTTFTGDLALEIQSRAGMLAYAKAGGSVNDSIVGRRFEGGIRLEF